MKPVAFDAALRARLLENIARSEHAPLDARGLKRAAVCVIVADDGRGEAALVLTRRAEQLSTHSGQFALPGGRVDKGESALDAARREAREEINLALAPEDFLGRLDDYPTRSGYLITPLVAWCAAMPPASCPIPRKWPASTACRWPTSAGPARREFVSIPESDQPVIRYPLLGTLIHAPTAAVMYQFMEVALLGRATRVAHLEQPVWAWR